MELNWSTFILEIINFLVLVWILKRFLYRPVRDVIVRRRAGIEKTLADASALHADAEQLREQYENRLANWEQERQQARATLVREIEAERARKTAELQTALEQEQQKAIVAEERRQADAIHRIEETALEQGARFACRLLAEVAGPELEASLIDMLLKQISSLPSARVEELRCSCAETPAPVKVVSAYPLAQAQRQVLETALRPIAGPDIPWQYEQDATLLAGVRISLGHWLLHANLQDELKTFAEFAHVSR